MKWTLFACFGCTNNTNDRKRPRTSKLRPKSKRIQGYQQLQSHVPKEFDDEDLRSKPKEENKARIRKKVRFNLDVIIYEPVSDYYDTSNSQEEDSNGKDLEEQALSQVYGLYAPARAVQSFPASHRYENFYDNKDYYDENAYEDEDSECEFSDLEDDDEDDDVINYRDLSSKPLINSTDKSLRISSEKSTYGQSRRHYAVPVLNPIENLSQWKAVKVRKC